MFDDYKKQIDDFLQGRHRAERIRRDFEMAIEYLGLSAINGPLVVLEGVSGAAYDEIVEMTVDGKEKKLGPHYRSVRGQSRDPGL